MLLVFDGVTPVVRKTDYGEYTQQLMYEAWKIGGKTGHVTPCRNPQVIRSRIESE